MDILDIDEVLKDDSFCLIEEDTEQDDISNILRQWRQNGCNVSDGRVDTRTFTRPKRRSAQNLESTFALASKSSDLGSSNIHLKIGGLVTGQMHKSFLQDTSPPSSISSSMDASSIDRMGNSLITSGDFTNVSFFKTDAEDVLSSAQIAGYNFDDMIKDRKALESLSLSGDSAIIKDCNIAQIDEITYLSKTNSGNSTMHNSTESTTSGVNESLPTLNQTAFENRSSLSTTHPSTSDINKTFNNKTINTQLDDFICNTTMTLIDSTHIVQTAGADAEGNLNITFDKNNCDLLNETFSKNEIINSTFDNMIKCPTTIMNRTYYKEEDGNETFDLIASPIPCDLENKPDFDSPVCTKKQFDDKHTTVQSTPHRDLQSVLPSVVSQTPSIQCIIEEVNISPIVPARTIEALDNEFQLIDETKPYSDKSIDQIENYLESLPDSFNSIQESNDIFIIDKPFQKKANSTLKNDLDLLANEKNEQEFDDLLEKLSKSACLDENIKMRQSINNIKKKHALLTPEKGQELSSRSIDSSVEINRLLSDSLCKSSLSSSNSSERLLSRRSRLYDDVQMSKNSSEHLNETMSLDDSMKAIGKTDPATVSNSSYTVESKTETPSPMEAVENAENNGEVGQNVKTKFERNRDPERFKTIRIFKKTTDPEFVVPCIDGEVENSDCNVLQDQHVDTTNVQNIEDAPSTISVFNNNKSEVEPNVMYQTYKKPRSSIRPSLISDQENIQTKTTTREIPKPRSLSRPKYFTGIARRDADFGSDALPKASSASDIHKSYIITNAPTTSHCNGIVNGMRKLSSNTMGTANQNTPQTNDLKSPMGTKAKSFTNLTGFSGSSSGTAGIPNANRLSIAKPNSQPSLLTQTSSGNLYKNMEKNDRSQLFVRSTRLQQNDDVEKDEKCAFKVPAPVSNLRAPNSRRTGLMRPSSGFYGQTVVKSDPEIQTGRYSSNNSLSSASSKGSVQDCQQQSLKPLNGHAQENNACNEGVFQSVNSNIQAELSTKTAPAPVKTGIPKPSGLRAPSTVRRSGLPRPSSVVRR